MFLEIEGRFRANLQRVRNMATLSNSAQLRGESGLAVLRADVLRAAVVLLHASLEDLLRSLAEIKLPTADPRFLERIPLASSDRSQGAKSRFTFTLGELSAHRGVSVDEVLRTSVRAHLGAATFNNPGDIKNLVEAIGSNPKLVEPYAGQLASMIGRRHLIAHRVDGEILGDSGIHAHRSIAIEDVDTWMVAVEGFGTLLLSTLRSDGLPNDEGAP